MQTLLAITLFVLVITIANGISEEGWATLKIIAAFTTLFLVIWFSFAFLVRWFIKIAINLKN